MAMGSPTTPGTEDGADDAQPGAERLPDRPSTEASTKHWRRMMRGVAPRAFASPISSDAFGHRDQHDVHATADARTDQEEMAATPPSRMVKVRSTEVAVERTDCFRRDGEVGVVRVVVIPCRASSSWLAS